VLDNGVRAPISDLVSVGGAAASSTPAATTSNLATDDLDYQRLAALDWARITRATGR